MARTTVDRGRTLAMRVLDLQTIAKKYAADEHNPYHFSKLIEACFDYVHEVENVYRSQRKTK